METLIRHYQQQINIATTSQTNSESTWNKKFDSPMYQILLMLIPATYLFCIQFYLAQRNFRLLIKYRDDSYFYEQNQKRKYNQFYFNFLFYTFVIYDILLLLLAIFAIIQNFWNNLQWILYVSTCIIGGFTHLIYSVCRKYYLFGSIIANFLYFATNQWLFIEMGLAFSTYQSFLYNISMNFQSFRVAITFIFTLHCIFQYFQEQNVRGVMNNLSYLQQILGYLSIFVLYIVNIIAFSRLQQNIGYMVGSVMIFYALFQNQKIQQQNRLSS